MSSAHQICVCKFSCVSYFKLTCLLMTRMWAGTLPGPAILRASGSCHPQSCGITRCLATDAALWLAWCICSALLNISVSQGRFRAVKAGCCFTMSLIQDVCCSSSNHAIWITHWQGSTERLWRLRQHFRRTGSSESPAYAKYQPHQALLGRTAASAASMLCRSPAGCV